MKTKPLYYRILEKGITAFYSTRLGRWLENRSRKKFWEWVEEVDRDTKNILVNEPTTQITCNVCRQVLNTPFAGLEKWIKLHRHENN